MLSVSRWKEVMVGKWEKQNGIWVAGEEFKSISEGGGGLLVKVGELDLLKSEGGQEREGEKNKENKQNDEIGGHINGKKSWMKVKGGSLGQIGPRLVVDEGKMKAKEGTKTETVGG